MATRNTLSALYLRRFADMESYRNQVWREICRYLRRFIPDDSDVLDIAAGYGEFINNIRVGRGKRFAVDLNPDTAGHLDREVHFSLGSAESLPLETASLDVVFISNFLEHLESPSALISVLGEASRVLRPGGRLIILQPLLELLGPRFWDFLDHKLPITEARLREATALCGFSPLVVHRRFLPYTMRGKRRVHPLLIRLYLNLMPFSGLILGKQGLFVLQKDGQ